MAYPGDPNYDPNRPSWLPYWLDSFQEQANLLAPIISRIDPTFSTVVTAREVTQPDRYYPAPPLPPAVRPPADIVRPPASGADAQETVDGILARQWAEWRAADQAQMNATAAAIEPGDSWALWAAAAGAAALLIVILTRR